MYLSELRIENFRIFGENEKAFTLSLNSGLVALIGENDTGKTAVIDALRFVLGTRDQEYFRVEDSDFHWPPDENERRTEIRIRCKFDNLTLYDKSTFLEYLTYVEHDSRLESVLYINWTAKGIIGTRSPRRFVSVELRSGKTNDGPSIDTEVRNLMRSTYLRPLRDAERAMSSGRGSRLSQILQHTKEIKEVGADYDPIMNPAPDLASLSVLGVGDYASALLGNREGIKSARIRLNTDYLKPLSFSGDSLTGHISVNSASDKDSRLRQLLEKLELELKDANNDSAGNRGLGSNNMLFMACELLLLGSEADGFPLLLIEEPEAHLHPQRQVRLIQFLQDQAKIKRSDGQQIQIIVTTHSPNLASTINVGNLVMIKNGKAFPLIEGFTRLEKTDYRFLERFLDVTKANLFFARGVIIVEGDGESLLIPTLARLIGRDLAEHGVSIVNVGHKGLRRFARIFIRKYPEKDGIINIPVACVTDLDVMPDCAPEIINFVNEGDIWPEKEKRRWRVKSDFTMEGMALQRENTRQRASGQNVETFVSNEWTLEYDLAYFGLAEDVWISAHLAKQDDHINTDTFAKCEVEEKAKKSFQELTTLNLSREQLASKVYALFRTGKEASKAIAAQYLSERLEHHVMMNDLTSEVLESCLPTYLVAAIKYVTPISGANEAVAKKEAQGNE